jgi:secondary thiamine-phosphate synthase enzyme
MWFQKQLTLSAKRRGFHLVTREIVDQLPELKSLEVGLLHVFIQHTSASLTINENADPDVRVDMEMAANHLVPDSLPYVHTMEGSDDMPAHIKGSLMGFSLSIPIRHGQLALGTWQGIYLCEHRNHGGPRRLVLTLHGEVS